MSFTVKQLTERFGGTIHGDANRTVASLAPLDSATPAQLAFLANPKYLTQVVSSQAGAVLISARDLDRLSADDRAVLSNDKTCIVTPNPYAYFARVAQLFVASAEVQPSLHRDPSAQIDASAQIAASAFIGPHAVVEAGVVIGERVRIEANVFIGRGTVLGDDCRVYPNATVYHGCTIGDRVIVHAGAVIGADGFGFAPDFAKDPNADPSVEGEWVKIPQVGGVRIGHDVEIGANTTIDRGAMADTVIEHAVKIDNQVQIAHNCRIGAYTVIAGCAGIAGSTVIGRHCMIGGAVGIAGHVTLADRVIVTAKSGVSKSLTRAGVYTSAFPAVDHLEWNKNAAIMRNLDKMRDRVKQLEAAVAEMKTAGKAEQ